MPRRLTAFVILLCAVLLLSTGMSPAFGNPIDPPPGWSDPLPGYRPNDPNIPKTNLPSFTYPGVEHLRIWASKYPPTAADLFGLQPSDKYPYGSYQRMIAEWNDKYAAEYATKDPNTRLKRWRAFVNRHVSGYASNNRGNAFADWKYRQLGIYQSAKWHFDVKVDQNIAVKPDAFPKQAHVVRAYEMKDALNLGQDARKQLDAYVKLVDKYGKQIVYVFRRVPSKKVLEAIDKANRNTAINKARAAAGLEPVDAIVAIIAPANAQSVPPAPDPYHDRALARHTESVSPSANPRKRRTPRGPTSPQPRGGGSAMVAAGSTQLPVDSPLSEVVADSADTPEDAAFEQEVSAGIGAQLGNEDVAAEPVGGVDFATLELRYVSDDYAGGPGLGFAFSANPAPEDVPAYGGRRNALLSSDSFFVWLALPTSAFTVNLNPDEPNRIMDERFGRTDAGRVLLEADLQMKKTVGKLIHPDSATGKVFWQRLAGEKCVSMRQWIVPKPAVVRESDGELHIIDAPLDVRMEGDVVNSVGVGGMPGGGCKGQSESVTKSNERLFRTTILPLIVKAVNEAPEYADLRRVYVSRVAAQFFRDRSLKKTTAYSDLIDSGDVEDWPAREPWDPKEVWQRFVKSYTDGEFKHEVRTERGDVIEIATYIYGGVDLTNIPRSPMSADRLTRERPELSTVVNNSTYSMQTESGKNLVWLGGRTTAIPLTEIESMRTASPTTSKTFWVLTALPVLLWVIGGVLFLVRRRGRSTWQPT